MDQGLFKKYVIQIKKNKDSKNDICEIIFKKTGITLEQEEITITKKKVAIYTSSVKKSKLLSLKIKDILQEEGYSLSM